MFRHVVLMTWTKATTGEQIASVVDGLRALPGQVAAIRGFSFGEDAGVSSGNADLAVVADFDDERGYREYAGHPAHMRLVDERIKPILTARTAVQYDATPLPPAVGPV